MAQHDYDLVNAPTLSVRAELNSILTAILTSNSGPLPPTEVYKGELWFDNDDPTGGVGVLQINTSTTTTPAWAGIPVDVDYLPLSGGTITGGLTVQGTFSNPDYDKAKGSYQGTAAPGNSDTGQLWYDTSVSPAVLKIKNPGDTAFIAAADMATPTFTDAMTVTGSAAGNNAHFVLLSQGTYRYIYNDIAGHRIILQSNPPNTWAAILSDAGDMYLRIHNGATLKSQLDAKQAALGFTPIRRTGGNGIIIGYSSPHLWIDGVDQGLILFGTPAAPVHQRAEIGALTMAYALAAVGVNGTLPGTSMRYYPTTQLSELVNVGTWRNLQTNLAVNSFGIFQRIA